MSRFSEKAYQLLRKSGWYEGRCVDPTWWVKEVERQGFRAFPCVHSFFSEFGGVCVNDDTVINGKVVRGEILYINASEGCNAYIERNYMPRVGKAMCPVGVCGERHADLVMAEDGSVYGGYAEELWRIGDDAYQAMDRLCRNANSEMTSIPELGEKAP